MKTDREVNEPANQNDAAGRSRVQWWKAVWPCVRVPVMLYLVLCVMMMWLENSLLFFPTKHPRGEWNPVGLKFEDAWFTTDDGVKLHGWYVPHPAPRAVMLFAHGNGGNITHRRERLATFH